MSLREYTHKRDFKVTREPKALNKTKAKTTPLMFVVQEHHASHLHYDFRLEWEGVLKSWAVPKGPSLDPKTKRLAVEVEDHPLDYGKFEGTIAPGQYGAGEVYIWDTGTWTPSGDLEAGLKKGHIDFTLKGKRLKGDWTLIRTRANSSGKAQWLLFKRSDEYAKAGNEAEVIGENDHHHTLIKTPAKPPTKKPRSRARQAELKFVEPQLAQLVSQPPEGDKWLHEIKLDGYRIQSQVTPSDVHLLTRTGLDWSDKFPSLIEPLKKLKVKNAVLDGEVVILDKEGHSSFAKLQEALKKDSSKNMFYYVFDILFLNGKDLTKKNLLERKKILASLIPQDKSILRFADHVQGHGHELLKEACRLNLEGIISKQIDRIYLSGRRDSWQKSKCSAQQEFVIGGYTEGTGSRASMGALLLGVYDGKKLRYVGKVGTGFNERSLSAISKKLKSLEQEQSPFDLKSPRERRIHWVDPALSAEISFANWTADEHLRAPVFKGLREDKPAKEIVVEKPDKPIKLRKQNKASKDPKRALSFSNPNKLLYHKEKITKQEVGEYYQSVLKYILPEIEDRPLSLVRSPEGTKTPGFFQKHINGKIPEGLLPISIREKDETRQYVTADSAQSLEALVQMGAFEIHAWNCRRDDIEHPDQIVMDFDPGPGVSWKTVIEAAFELRGLLKKLNLQSFVKLSGGKGVHVHIPIATKYSWDQIKNFSHSLAKQMTLEAPHKYTAKVSKTHREKKIFVDYLRNGRGSTAVIPYSLRAKPVSSVALPVAWNKLKEMPSANYFSLKKTLLFLKKRRKDPWEGMHKLRQRIAILEA